MNTNPLDGSTLNNRAAPPSGSNVPLSFTQQRLWFLSQLEPGMALYNRPWVLDLHGPIQVEIMQESLNHLFQRHAILRSIINPLPTPTVTQLPLSALNIPVYDFKTQQDAIGLALTELQELNIQPMDTTHGPLFRPAVFLLSPTRSLLSLLTHQLIFDGWSEHVLLQDLNCIYSTLSEGRPLSQAPPPQYYEWAQNQHSLPDPPSTNTSKDHWESCLCPAPTRIFAPDVSTSAAGGCCRTAIKSIELDSITAHMLQQLAVNQKTSILTCLLTVFGALFHRLSGHDSLYFGMPAAARLDSDARKTIGPFINTLPVLMDASGSPTFLELLQRVRSFTLLSFPHQAYPFEKMIHLVRPERDPDNSPVFDILINARNFPTPPDHIGPLACTSLEQQNIRNRTPLTIFFTPDKVQPGIDFLYRQDLYTSGKIQILATHFNNLLHAFLLNPEVDICQPPLQHAFPPGIQQPSIPLKRPEYPSVIEKFLHHTRTHPEAEAVCMRESSLSYRELHATASTISGALKDIGCKPGSRIAFLSEQRVEYSAAALAVLGSRSVLITLDPALPEARILQLLSISGTEYLITTDTTRKIFKNGMTGKCIPLSLENLCQPSSAPPSELEPPLQPDDPAYISFTSGSTGIPKAILGKHEGLNHYLAWETETFSISPSDRIGQLSSPNSDALLRNLFLATYSGAALCLPDQEAYSSIPQWLDQNRITIQHTVPSLFRLWMKGSPDQSDLPSLRILFLSGEPLTGSLVRDIRSRFPVIAQIVNMYGPTETTLIKTSYYVPETPAAGVQPLGEPQPHSQVLILNRAGTLCGTGEPGEIIIRTPFGTLGYLNAREDASKAFLADPWDAASTFPIYRTGDLGQYNLKGDLLYLGRIDEQVKILGVRIEPNEVAAVLEKHPAVDQCSVRIFKPVDAEPRLCAYLVLQPGETNNHNFRSHASRHLPSSMVPSYYVILDSLPLLPNGKVDTHQLPPPIPDSRKSKEPYVPADPKLQALLDEFKRSLGISQIYPGDNFFDLGGDSLQALHLLNKTTLLTGVELPAAAIYHYPTIESLFQHIHTERVFTASRIIVPLETQGDSPPLFLIHWAGGFTNMYHELARKLSPPTPVFGFQARGLDSGERPGLSIKTMARDYVTELLQFHPDGPYRLAGASMGGKIAFEMARQLINAGRKVEFVGLIDSRAARSRPSLHQRVQSHQQNVRRSSLNETIHYFRSRLEIQLHRLVYRCFLFIGVAPSRPSSLHLYHLEVSRRFRPSHFPGSVTIFRAARQRDLQPGPFLGWENHAASVDTFEIPGTHTSLLTAPGVDMLADLLNRKLWIQ